MKLTVDGFRGCKSAILDGGPIIIVGGASRSGKSSMCEAVAAVLCGLADARAVEKGVATASSPTGSASIFWPDGVATTSEDWTKCSEIAVGRLAAMSATTLADLLKAHPEEAIALMAFTKAGLTDQAAQKLWRSVGERGWDVVESSLRAHGKTLSDPEAMEANERLLTVAGPNGLRAQALAPPLETFNRTLAETGKPWTPVTIDRQAKLRIGGRGGKDASDAEMVMARAVFQIAAATIDGSPMVVLDLGGWLDVRLRNDLVDILRRHTMAALIAYTCNRARQVPDVSADIGTSFWMEDGVARPRSECVE